MTDYVDNTELFVVSEFEDMDLAGFSPLEFEDI